ncbi:MAG: plasmid pRiA4b ORF-3 family protein [Thermaerobacter sp.]|nr:plasmid pRiA4b ORF-3 family protein [Thermaerobacter sp.]
MPRKPRAGEGFSHGFIIDPAPFLAGMEYARYEAVDQQPITAKIIVRSALGRYPAIWLKATLDAYGIPERGVKRDKLAAVAEALQDPRRLAPVVASLSDNGRAILSQVLAAGGLIKYQSVARKFGDETEDGYFWSSQPPTSHIGQLRLHGLLFVGRMPIGQRREKVLVIPSDLREVLATLLPAASAPPPQTAPASVTVYELDVVLSDIEPPIWRGVSVPGSINLTQLSQAIQSAMGWEGHHLFEFVIGRDSYGEPDPELGLKNASRVRLEAVANQRGRAFQYLYDFGDNWIHQVIVRSIRPLKAGETVPALTGGGRACPPEDVGGIPGYHDFLTIIADPAHAEHQDTLTWAGGEWDAEHFDHAALEARLLASARRGRWLKTAR